MELRAAGLPEPVREYRFHPVRRWRLDLAWPDHMVACEVEGGVWLGRRGRHTHPAGYERDCEKYTEAAILGWCVIRVTPSMIRSGYALDAITRALMRDAEDEAR